MLHWLQPNTPRRRIFFLKLAMVSLLFHALFVFCLFFYHVCDDIGYRITLNASQISLVDLVVVPDGSVVRASVDTAQRALPTVPPKKVIKKTAPVPTSIKKMLTPKKSVAKKQTNPVPKKTAERSVQKTEQKKVPEKKQDNTAKNPNNAKINSTAKADQNMQTQPAEKKIVSQKEYDQLELQQLLQDELSVHWQPPVGLAADLCCEVCVAVDQSGSVQRMDVVEPSGVLMYDVHAQSTLMALRYPKQTWGKQLTITFKQA